MNYFKEPENIIEELNNILNKVIKLFTIFKSNTAQ